MRRRLVVFGLDAAAPELVFKKFLDYLPNFRRVIEKSVHGRLRSCDPPITVPAWMVMMTGREPGELGLYGFRHRSGYSYTEYELPSSRSIRRPRVWDVLGAEGLRSFVMGVPPSYPPYRVNGWLISCFLTPDDSVQFTHPLPLKYEVKRLVGRYVFDVPFRREDRDWVLDRIHEMTDIHEKVALEMLVRKPWDFFMYMEIGLDRVQHAFWKYMDRDHRRYEEHPRFSRAILEYYVRLDRILGEIIRRAGDADILIVSDHGAKRMDGAFAINDWLVEQGYLKLRRDVEPGTRISKADVDWGETIAWGWGGYYSRIFLNVEGREEMGIVSREEYEDVLREISRKILGIRGPDGEVWRNVVYRPVEIYREVNGNPPDLMVYFDDLYWRAAGTMGYETPYLEENDTGPDDAVHDYDGIFIWYNRGRGVERDASIYDVFPTILRFYGLEPPEEIRGEAVEEVFRNRG